MTYLFGHFLLVDVVQQVLGKELDWVVGLLEVSLTQGLGEDEGDVVLPQVFDVGVLLTQKLV